MRKAREAGAALIDLIRAEESLRPDLERLTPDHRRALGRVVGRPARARLVSLRRPFRSVRMICFVDTGTVSGPRAGPAQTRRDDRRGRSR